MSLLNDALRDIERRDANPQVPINDIPPGLRGKNPGPRLRLPFVAGAVVLLLAGGFYLGRDVPGSSVVAAAQIERPAPVTPQPPVVEVAAPTPTPTPAPELEPEPEPAPVTTALVHAGATESAPVPPPPPETIEKPETGSSQNTVSEAGAPQQPETFPEPSAGAPVAATDAIKQLPRSADARDRRLAPKLERMLIEGREDDAGQALKAALAEGLPMPQSHGAMARYYLIQKRLTEASRWLPSSLVASELDLRLLQGRLILMRDGPEAALRYLALTPPEAAKAPGYIATLAALYQQTGQHAAAGKQWIALLETNSQRPDWWLGLALALDAQDQLSGARMAYNEALALPDMSPRLRTYAQSRLDALL